MSETSLPAAHTASLFLQAAQANAATSARVGSLVELSAENADDCLITADLHGNQENFRRIVALADLAAHRRRHLVMQEVCHGGPMYETSGGCKSHQLLEAVAQLKCDYPQQVHFLISNHELSELTDHPICKGNKLLNLLFRFGLQEAYGDDLETVRDGMRQFIASCPAAVRLANGVFISHSIPEDTDRRGFDFDVFRRTLRDADLLDRGAVFRLVWGRDFRKANAQAFAGPLGAHLLVNGHEPAPRGYLLPNDQQIVLDCCGPSACYLLLDVRAPIDHATAAAQIRRLADHAPAVAATREGG